MEISRGKTQILPRIDAGFTTCTLAGVATGAVDKGLCGHVPAGPECTTPHIRFLFIVPRFRLGLPPHPASRRRTCPLANLRLYMPGTGTFTRLDSCHARHTRRGQRSPKAIRWAALLYEAAIVNANSVVDQGRRCRLACWHASGAHAPRPTQHATGLALRSPWRQLCFKRLCIPTACGPANAPRKVTDSPSNSHKRKPYFGSRQSCWPGTCNTT